jgi:capreomycidine synthase
MTERDGTIALTTAALEEWLRDRYFTARVDISGSGVDDYSLAEVRDLTGLELDLLDSVVFRDSESTGARPLRTAIAQRYADGDPDLVMVTHGSSEAIYLAMRALLRPGDRVVALDPAYHSLHLIAEDIGCVVHRWRLAETPAQDIAGLCALITPGTAAVVVNFPHNPTGVTIDHDQLTMLTARCAEVGAYMMFDAAFGELTYDAVRLPDPVMTYPKALSFGTLSKAFGLPGLRVGWCLATPGLLRRMVLLRDYTTLSVSPLVEAVAEAVLTHTDAVVGPRLEQARHNRDIVDAWVCRHEHQVSWVKPAGGVTGLVRLTHQPDTVEFATRLHDDQGVLVVPGECFGRTGTIRLGFGGPTAVVTEGLDALSTALSSTAGRVA